MKTWQELIQAAREKATAVKALLESDEPDMTVIAGLQADAERLKDQALALKANTEFMKGLDAPNRLDLPTGGDGGSPGDTDDPKPDAVKSAIHVLRYGDIDASTDAIMREAYSVGDYRGLLLDQAQAFIKYIRFDQGAQILRRQLWGVETVKTMLRDGVSMGEVKSTMVEGEDVLGGYAVPPDVASQILARMKGLTAVRDGGAMVIQSASKQIEWVKLTGGGNAYPTAMRGIWGSETTSPSSDDFSFGLQAINAHVYTYKVAMSVSLLEDAANVVPIFTQLVADTFAIDEDTVFLVGDGANKPKGILQDGDNTARSLSEVISGNAATLSITGLKALKRGVASQYRIPGRATVIGEGATGTAIEAFQDGNGRFYFDSLDHGETKLYGATWRESDAMPTIGAGTYPLIYGDLSGYAIVERLGMAIRRYNDSNTGVNVVEFHVRRRIGGDVIEPWKLAVQKCSAS